jgi:hypothetical protein
MEKIYTQFVGTKLCELPENLQQRKYELSSIYFVLGRKVSINNRMYKASGKTGLQSAFVKQTKE